MWWAFQLWVREDSTACTVCWTTEQAGKPFPSPLRQRGPWEMGEGQSRRGWMRGCVAVWGDRKPGVETELWLETYHLVGVLSLLNPAG